ncbi:L-ectoine synthase OS=Streptomyces tendae OX=1932 GN=ectC PE=3 SV=1 [Streptomyces tendae]
MWYANHIEAVVCTKGDAELTDRETEDVPHHAGHDVPPQRPRAAHAQGQGGLPLHLCFNPPVTGREDHDENGVYPLLTEEV